MLLENYSADESARWKDDYAVAKKVATMVDERGYETVGH